MYMNYYSVIFYNIYIYYIIIYYIIVYIYLILFSWMGIRLFTYKIDIEFINPKIYINKNK